MNYFDDFDTQIQVEDLPYFNENEDNYFDSEYNRHTNYSKNTPSKNNPFSYKDFLDTI